MFHFLDTIFCKLIQGGAVSKEGTFSNNYGILSNLQMKVRPRSKSGPIQSTLSENGP